MQRQFTNLPEITLVGLSMRTNNANEMNPETSKIAGFAGNYWHSQVANDIKNRVSPGVTYAVYTEFESDENGDYSYFIGEVVSSLDGQDLQKFNTITIPASNYEKFTTPMGKMPDIIIDAWQQIWAFDFGGARKYIADFEIYDQRALDPNNAVADIYIGVK